MDNSKRFARFTSSKISALTSSGKQRDGFGVKAITYIQEKKYERKLGRSISQEVNARPLQWGKLCEPKAFENLGLEYTLVSSETIEHPLFKEYWSGSPDGVKDGCVYDIKCPITLLSFCKFYDCETKEQLIDAHDDGEKYYYQLVSNAILTNTNKAELIIYCPYKSELDSIRLMADEANINWVKYSADDELPYLIDGGYYKNIKIIKLDIPQSDKDFLTGRVTLAIKQLNEI